MKFYLYAIFLFLVLLSGVFASAQLQEPKSDPTFNEAQAKPSQVDIDDAADVQLKRTTTPVDTEIADDIAPPERHLVTKPDNSPAPSFSVTRVRVDSKKVHAKTIQLLTPAHNTIYTPGVITFSWKYTIPPKKKSGVTLKVERLDGRVRYAKKVFKEKKLLDLSPGAYKWQVETGKPGQESRWRIFKVEDTKSHSLTELYNGPTQSKKTKKQVKPIISAYIKEVPDSDDDSAVNEDQSEMEAGDEPLPIPDSLRRSPADAKPQTETPEPQLATPDWVK